MANGSNRRLGLLPMWVLTGLLAPALVNPAGAATINPCPDDFVLDGSAKVHDGATSPGVLSAASACQYLTPPDNDYTVTEENVNAVGFFDTTTWSSIYKIDLASNAGQSGTWAIPGTTDFATYQYMITFKDGKGTNLLSFLLNGEFSSGAWSSPFTNPPFTYVKEGMTKNVSHFGIFRSDKPISVPEPGTLILAFFGFGLVGAGATRFKTDSEGA